MAYFSNSSAGMAFDEQCNLCKHGDAPCPIALVQSAYNYEACNNKVARSILDHLVSNSGECAMHKVCEKDFYKDPGQVDLFNESITR